MKSFIHKQQVHKHLRAQHMHVWNHTDTPEETEIKMSQHSLPGNLYVSLGCFYDTINQNLKLLPSNVVLLIFAF